MQKIVLASNNAHKLEELAAVLNDQFELVTAGTFNIRSPEETGTTFVENAIIKARHAAEIAGLPAIADDSGLEVDCLSGSPGIRSARFAGHQATDADNNRKLLELLSEESQRTAHFRSVIVMMRHAADPMPLIASGTWHGEILRSPRGESGFGYDPLFYIPDLGVSVAELPPGEKNRLSHRGQALIELRRLLEQE